MPQILISADYLSAREIHLHLSAALPEQQPELVNSTDVERGDLTAAEAVVIAAVTSGVFTLLAEVIKSLVAIYIERQKTGKSGPDTVIVIQQGTPVQPQPIVRVNPADYVDASIQDIREALPDLPEEMTVEDQIWAQYLDDE
ncbi:MAG: hypothetical protein AAFN92_05780 [Bacteroidota bacterium]